MILRWNLRLSKTNTKERRPFHLRELECKSRNWRDTWSNRQVWPWSTKWGRAKANRVLPRECTGHCKHTLPTIQEMTLHMDITRWSIPKSDWIYSLQPKKEKPYSRQKLGIGSLPACLLIVTHVLLLEKLRVPQHYCGHLVCTQQICLGKFYIYPQGTCTRKCP